MSIGVEQLVEHRTCGSHPRYEFKSTSRHLMMGFKLSDVFDGKEFHLCHRPCLYELHSYTKHQQFTDTTKYLTLKKKDPPQYVDHFWELRMVLKE